MGRVEGKVVLSLASDEARYLTGVALPIDAGVIIKIIR
jgi:hypothetical protein